MNTNYTGSAKRLLSVIDDVINNVIPKLKSGTENRSTIPNIRKKLLDSQAEINRLKSSFNSKVTELLKKIGSVPDEFKNNFNKSMLGFKIKKYPTLFEMSGVLRRLSNLANNANRSASEKQSIANAAKRLAEAEKRVAEKNKQAQQTSANINVLNKTARGIKTQIGNNTGLSNTRFNRIINTVRPLTKNGNIL